VFQPFAGQGYPLQGTRLGIVPPNEIEDLLQNFLRVTYHRVIPVLMRDKLPTLSHLQFAVLDALGTGVLKGRQLRRELASSGINKSGPGFYQLMARLEEGKLVDGWIDQKIVDGQIIKERFYKVTGEGFRAKRASERFYESCPTQ
jgi:hypothetical protein